MHKNEKHLNLGPELLNHRLIPAEPEREGSPPVLLSSALQHN
jgi:hypothetical protein